MPRTFRRTPATEEAASYGYRNFLQDIVAGVREGASRNVERLLGGDVSGEELLDLGLAGVGAGTKIARGLGKGKFPFSLKTTDIPAWDAVLKRPGYHKREKGVRKSIEFMSSKEYFELLDEKLGFEAAAYVHPQTVEKYAKAMEKGAKFPMPALEYKGSRLLQEGRHRMLAAEKLGIDRVPVLMMKSGTQTGLPSLRTLEEVAFRKAISEDPIKSLMKKYSREGLKYDDFVNPLPDMPELAYHQWTFYGEGPLKKATFATKTTELGEMEGKIADMMRKFQK